QLLKGWMQRSKRPSQICSILARVSCTFRCFGPDASAVMNGRLMSTDWVEESAILAFSASSLRRWRAIGSFLSSIPFSFLKSSTSHVIRASSQLSPPITWLVENFKKENGIDLRKDPMALQRLKEEAEKAKIALSSTQSVDINLPFI